MSKYIKHPYARRNAHLAGRGSEVSVNLPKVPSEISGDQGLIVPVEMVKSQVQVKPVVTVPVSYRGRKALLDVYRKVAVKDQRDIKIKNLKVQLDEAHTLIQKLTDLIDAMNAADEVDEVDEGNGGNDGDGDDDGQGGPDGGDGGDDDPWANILIITTLWRLLEGCGANLKKRNNITRAAELIHMLTGIPLQTCKNDVPPPKTNSTKMHQKRIVVIERYLRILDIDNLHL